ncbi:glutamyl-tRNA reductase [Natranaerobius trueperi]|uniref:glutamyl-tRNA reductase n=1 Tax=Natranaerobius trueperi TaxID=759412 RepID=UPI00130373A8|nr:glutamyl-tRNA reductase [Natranaerobius trueperi]
MDVVVLGLNHKTAPVEIREKLSFNSKEVKQFISSTVEKKNLAELSVLSTCNRTEIHFLTDNVMEGINNIINALTNYCNLTQGYLYDYLYTKTNEEAITHIFEVAAGLNSLVIGETEILGQIKQAYYLSDEAGGISSIFHGLYQHVIKAGKKVHSETQINDNAASVSYASVELAKEIFGDLKDKSVLLIGAGQMSELCAKHLLNNGVKSLTVLNRTLERARRIADQFGASYASYEELHNRLQEVDILISSTGAPHFILRDRDIKTVMDSRNYSRMFLIDIAVPRDIDPYINNIDNVYLYCIDDLESVVESNMKVREQEARKAKIILNKEVIDFMAWFKIREVVPLISALKDKADNIRESELQNFQTKLSNLSDKEKQVIDKLTKRIINQLLKEPVLNIKELAAKEKSDVVEVTLAQLFNLEEQVLTKEKLERVNNILEVKDQTGEW